MIARLAKIRKCDHDSDRMHERFYPKEENLGKDCLYWQGLDTGGKHSLARFAIGCMFPKYEMEGRLSCEGIVDDVCLYLKDGRRPSSLSQDQIDEIRFRIPDGDNRNLPPGHITP